jgi:hypothetical protein
MQSGLRVLFTIASALKLCRSKKDNNFYLTMFKTPLVTKLMLYDDLKKHI